MKRKLLKSTALLFAVILLCLCLASCNKLSGTYTSVDKEVGTSYKFHFFSNKVTMYYLNFPFDGTYELDKKAGKIYMTFLGDRVEKTFSQSGKSIFIDGVEYVKEK
ncbi:MAG: hypothetical protein GX057_04150 [Clostridiales bacterium]|nr:hypothetical protein [Clostridiales bacterium]